MNWSVIFCCCLISLLTSPVISSTAELLKKQDPKPTIAAYTDSQNGTMLDSGMELVVTPGSKVTIDCEGISDLTLSVVRGPAPRLDSPYTGMNISQVTQDQNISGTVFISKFIVYVESYQYTGEYICRYVHFEREDLSRSLYIYAKDPVNLFAPFIGYERLISLPYEIMRITHLQRAVIPCRVTNPDVSVTFRKKHPPMPIMVGDKFHAISYDKQKGYIVQYPDMLFSGFFICKGEYNGTVQVTLMLFSYIFVRRTPPSVRLHGSETTVLVGGHFNLHCSVTIDRGTQVFMTWKYASNETIGGEWENATRTQTDPSQNLPVRARVSDRVRYTKPTRLQGRSASLDIISSVLHVWKVQPKDEGSYMCQVQTVYNKTGQAFWNIEVYYEEYCDVTADAASMTVPEGQKKPLILNVNCLPNKNITTRWFKDDTEITNNPMYIIENLPTETFLVAKWTRDMAGVYTVFVNNTIKGGNTSITVIVEYMQLTVKPPGVNDLYKLNSVYNFTCKTVESDPVTDIVWEWSPFVSISQLDSEDNVTAVNWTVPTWLNTSYRITDKSLLRIVSQESGILQCTAKSDVAEKSVNKTVIVSEVDGGFAVLMSGTRSGDLIAGDSAVLECYASIWLYKSVTMYYRPKGSGVNLTVLPSNNTNITSTRSEYSHIVTAVISPIQESDDGNYGCEAVFHDDDNNTENVEKMLTVKAVQKPWFRQTNIQINIPVQSQLGILFKFPECLVDGVPFPTVIWYKDGEAIETLNQTSGYILSDHNQSLMINGTSEAHEGVYTCVAENRGGSINGNWTVAFGEVRAAPLTVEKPMSPKIIIAVVAVATILVVMILVISVCWYKRRAAAMLKNNDWEKYLTQPASDYNPDLPIDEQTTCIPYDPKWEFHKKRLRQGMVLGQGAFGRVIKAEAIGILDQEDVTIVAVKMVKDCTDRDQMEALLSELKILIHVGQHLNIVNLLGAVTKDIKYGELYVIVEYCHFGNLRNYLLKNKNTFKDIMDDYVDPEEEKRREALKEAAANKPYYVNKALKETSADLIGPALTTKNLICWSFQVARGMDYLSSKKYIHRDLAARNVLLAEDNVVKICDFGLAKDCYKNPEYLKKGDGPVPVKWMAIESLTHRLYTTKSDVWSYGIFIWELFSLGGSPYPGVEINEKFIDLIRGGYIMDKPQHASEEMYKVMKATWRHDPDDRPSFSQLASLMGDFLEANVKQYYLDLNEPYVKMVDLQKGSDGSLKAEGGACGEQEGYYKMNGNGSDYTKMSPAPPPPTEVKMEDERYVNHNVLNRKEKEKGRDLEMVPLTLAEEVDEEEEEVVLRKKREATGGEESPTQVHTFAEVHRPDDTDSGHSSTYAPGTSPDIGADGYLVPKADGLGFSSASKKENEEETPFISPNVFGPDYRYGDHPPPTYSAVIQDSDLNV